MAAESETFPAGPARSQSATIASPVLHAGAGSANRGTDRFAVVDIGSNSVRVVIYEGPRRAPVAICNEKALCGLGRGISTGGQLNAGAVHEALTTLARFREIIRYHGDPPVAAVATAAIRDASDGAAFVERANELGFDITVITGEREAELSALGVISAEPTASGIVGDMGGGSLELVKVDQGVVEDRISLPIGPLRLIETYGPTPTAAIGGVRAALDSVGWLPRIGSGTLYAVGGAWRALARIHMQHRRHPLSVLHHYEAPAREIVETCNLVARQSRSSLEDIPGVARKRIDTLPHSAIVLALLIERADIRSVMISAGGLREGILFDRLPLEERNEDPLLAGARFFAERLAPVPEYGEAACGVIEALFVDDPPSSARIRSATCRLVDIGAFFHPDLRGVQAFDTALRAPYLGISHAERVMIAFALFTRHEGKIATDPIEPALKLLSPESRQWALCVGLALRFVCDFAPKIPSALEGCALSKENGTIVFRMPSGRQTLLQDLPRRRLAALAAAMGTTFRIAYTD